MVEPEHEPTIAVEREFVGRRVRVQVERVRLDDGTETLRDMVYHPDSVVIVPLDDDGNVVMVRQYRKAAGRELLELPAGVMDPGDASPLEAARRELREETGLDADDLRALGNFFAAPGSLTECLYSYLARGLRVSPLPPDVDERIVVERVAFRDALRMAREGTLNDAKTLASLLLAEPYAEGGEG